MARDHRLQLSVTQRHHARDRADSSRPQHRPPSAAPPLSASTTRSAASRARRRRAATRSTSTKRKAAATKRRTRRQKRGATRRNAARPRARVARDRPHADQGRPRGRPRRREAAASIERVGDVAERTVLTDVGATLIARDSVVELVGTYTRPQARARAPPQGASSAAAPPPATARARGQAHAHPRRARAAPAHQPRRAPTLKRPPQGRRRLSRDAQTTSPARSSSAGAGRRERRPGRACIGGTKAAREVTGRVASLV